MSVGRFYFNRFLTVGSARPVKEEPDCPLPSGKAAGGGFGFAVRLLYGFDRNIPHFSAVFLKEQPEAAGGHGLGMRLVSVYARAEGHICVSVVAGYAG